MFGFEFEDEHRLAAAEMFVLQHIVRSESQATSRIPRTSKFTGTSNAGLLRSLGTDHFLLSTNEQKEKRIANTSV